MSNSLKTTEEKSSYALGVSIGMSLFQEGLTPLPEVFARGVADVLSGNVLALSEDELHEVLMQLRQQTSEKQETAARAAGETNLKAGREFLEKNKQQEGVITLPSGLQYKVIKQGDGPKPKLTDTVLCNYRGTLLNGTEFDSSYQRGTPAQFPVNRVISGWTELLQMMPTGSHYQAFIPAELAYGTRGAGADIGPNETLIFEIELLQVAQA